MSILSAGTSNTTSLIYTGDTTGAMVFQTNGTTEAMRIDSSGRLLVGATSAAYSTLNTQINCNSGGGVGGAGPSPSVFLNYNSAGGAGQFNVLGLHYNFSTIGNGPALSFSALDAGSSRYTTALIGTSTTSNTAAAISANLQFYTVSSATLTERVRITSGGNVQLTTAGTKILNSSGNPILQQTGSVLQVVQTIKTDTFSELLGSNTNSTTNCIEVSITPTSSSSKILVMVSITGSSSYWAGTGAGSFQGRLMRGSTSIAIGDAAGSRNRMTTRAGAYSTSVAENMSFNYLDSPATTSSVTYGFRLDNVDNASQTMYLNRAPIDGDSATSIARTASSIIVMEIAA